MVLDQDGTVFTQALHEKYVEMHSRAVQRQEAVFKAVAVFDGLLAILLFGGDIDIPGLAIAVRSLPAAIEVMTLLSSFAMMLASMAFVNAQSYEVICDQFSRRIAARKLIDPEFISAAFTFSEIALKLFRPQMNHEGLDLFVPGKGYTWYYNLVVSLLKLTFICLGMLHLGLLTFALMSVVQLSILSILFALAVALLNSVAILIFAMPGFQFEVRLVDQRPRNQA